MNYERGRKAGKIYLFPIRKWIQEETPKERAPSLNHQIGEHSSADSIILMVREKDVQ